MRRCLTLLLVGMTALAFGVKRTGPEISAKSALIMDAETGRILWSKDPYVQRYPASTTKILTALLLIERCKPDEVIVAPDDIELVQPSSLHLKPGERVTAREMLYALMLRSANDGSVAVAKHIGGSVEGFAKLMNERAKAIGCQGSHFANPNGLNDDRHVTTAYDLALITREAMRHPEFNEVIRTQKHQIVRSTNLEDLWLVNKNKWLKMDPTVDGVKTGFTVPAGQCFVGSATRDGMRIITVILKSDAWVEDQGKLVEWGFQNYRRVCFDSPDRMVSSTKLDGTSGTPLMASVSTPVYGPAPKSGENGIIRVVRWELPKGNAVKAGEHVGTLTYSDGADWRWETELVAMNGIDTSPLQSLTSSRGNWIGGILLAALASGYWFTRRKARSIVAPPKKEPKIIRYL